MYSRKSKGENHLAQHYPKELVLFPRSACTLEEWARLLCQPILAGHVAQCFLKEAVKMKMLVCQGGSGVARSALGKFTAVFRCEKPKMALAVKINQRVNRKS